MFFHLFKYKILAVIRNKDDFMWSALFPLLLGTLFYLGFGNLMNGNDVKFSPFPIAVVENSPNETFSAVLSELSTDGENAMFIITDTDMDNATALLKEGRIEGIITIDNEPEATISSSGFNQTILVSFMKQYTARAAVITDIATNHPEQLPHALDKLGEDISYNHNVNPKNATIDVYVQYFYALIAMSCIYCAATGVRAVCSFQANMSELGKRREVAPTHKFTLIIADFSAIIFIQWIYDLLLIGYLLVLGIDLGDRIPLVILTAFVGSIIGIAIGFFIGSLFKSGVETKNSISTAVTMSMCFLSGLMICDMKDIIEHTCPIINRVNPAALITDALYALNMFPDYGRFIFNLVTMLVIAGILCFASYLLLRRNTYADL